MKIQRPFHQDFRDMLLISKTERTIGKPFVPEDCSDLIQFGKRDVIPENVINTIMNISDVFNLQYEIFRYSLLISHIVSMDAAIKKNQFAIPGFKHKRTVKI